MDEFQKLEWGLDAALWEKGCIGDVAFLKAGQGGPIGTVSVSPLSDVEGDDDADDEPIEGDLEGEAGERVGLPREDEGVRKIQNPVMPCKEDVEMYYLKGHIPFRSWCPICVKAFGKEMDHKRDDGKERRLFSG